MNGKSNSNQIRKISICFFLSGLAALLYQTAWMRQLSVVFGTSELAVATVLTAYMSGLSLGAAVAAKFIDRIKQPLLTYGILEGGIAISAIAVPFLLIAIGDATSLVLGGQESPPEVKGVGQLLIYFVATLLILVFPTALMGATLPLLIKHVLTREEEIGEKVGGLYSLNTFGAIAGTLIAAFILLPNISLLSTILVGAAINLLVLLVILNISKTQSFDIDPTTRPLNPIAQQASNRFWKLDGGWILPIMTLSGVATFTYEVLWTRLISHILGGSVPAFAVMLAGFLIGIAIGSAVAAKYAKSKQQARNGFILVQIGIAVAAAITFYAINAFTPEKGGLYVNSLLSLALLLPSTLFVGATFPFAVRIFASSVEDAPVASARVYAWNTIGAIFGAAFAGYFLIPWVRYEGAIEFAVLLNFSLALLTFFLVLPSKTSLASKLVPVICISLVALLYNPAWPENIIRFSPLLHNTQKDNALVYYDVGRSSTVLMTEANGHFWLRNNGLPESAITMAGQPKTRHSQSILSTLPVIARPDAKTMLVAGFGGGVVVEDVAPSIDEIDVLELEPKVIEANKMIADRRLINPLADPRINLIFNDARSALNLTNKKYDIIISQPSHPWTAGASHLYTREYMQLVEAHLEEDGVFLQWMSTAFTDEYLLRSLTATLVDTFEHVRVYQFSPTVLSFLASNEPLEIEKQILLTSRPFVDDPVHFAAKGFTSPESLLAGLAMDTEGARRFAKSGKVVTDNFNTLGTRSALTVEGDRALTYDRLTQIVLDHSPLYSKDSWVYSEFIDSIKVPYLTREVQKLGRGELYKSLHLSLAANDNQQAYSILHNLLRNSGRYVEGRQSLLDGIRVNPNDIQQKYLLIRDYIERSSLDDASKEIRTIFNSMDGAPKIVLDNLKNISLDSKITHVFKENDLKLATAEQNDEWFIPALRSRIIWRMKEGRLTNNNELLSEAEHMLTALIINQPVVGNIELKAILSHYSADFPSLHRSLIELRTNYTKQLTAIKENPLIATALQKSQIVRSIERLVNEISDIGAYTPSQQVFIESELTQLKETLASWNETI